MYECIREIEERDTEGRGVWKGCRRSLEIRICSSQNQHLPSSPSPPPARVSSAVKGDAAGKSARRGCGRGVTEGADLKEAGERERGE